MTKNEILAREIVRIILYDIQIRADWNHMWDATDEDRQWEIEHHWRKLVIECLS
jgi:hypothetical protein